MSMKRIPVVSVLLASALVLGAVTAIAAVDVTTKPAPKAPKKPAGAAAAAAVAGDKALAAIDAQIAAAKVDKSKADWRTHLPKPTAVKFDPAKQYKWVMVTNKGTMVFAFKPDVAPLHVTSFMYLTRLGYFDGLKFHRVIKNFMAQGGCPLGTGTGGPGYAFDIEVNPNVLHDKRGVLSTANTGMPGSDGSQFFVMFRPYPSLNGKYSIFGQLERGMEVLDKFEAAGNPGDGAPTEPLTIVKATVEVQ